MLSHWYTVQSQGWIQKFQKGGTGSQILERGCWNVTFQCCFQSFSYKSLTNIPPKGGGHGPPPAPPLNLHLNRVVSQHSRLKRTHTLADKSTTWQMPVLWTVPTKGSRLRRDHEMTMCPIAFASSEYYHTQQTL